MPYGYLGQTPNQQVKNSGVFSVGDAKALTDVGQLGGSLELIQEQVITSTTSAVDFTDLKNYDVQSLVYLIYLNQALFFLIHQLLL